MTKTELPEETTRYSALITRTIARLEKIWLEGEGSLEISVTDDAGRRRWKIKGGETERGPKKEGEE